MNKNLLIEALKTIKSICELHYMDCSECPLGNGNQCRIFESQPWEWNFIVKESDYMSIDKETYIKLLEHDANLSYIKRICEDIVDDINQLKMSNDLLKEYIGALEHYRKQEYESVKK